MWSRVNRALSEETIAAVLRESREIAAAREDRHFVFEGKKFFLTRPKLLRRIHLEVDRALGLRQRVKSPALNHAFLLFKSGPGPATKAHQDRAYWLDIETDCSMFTVWIALERIDGGKGALMLNPSGQSGLDDFFKGINRGELLAHHPDQYGGGGFTTVLDDGLAANLRANMTAQEADAGDVILFDAFEPHASTENTQSAPRLAMKLVYGSRLSMNSFMIDLDKLEGRGIGARLFNAIGAKH